MTVRALDALVLFTNRLPEVASFYAALGIPLEEERHDDGPVHWACELGPVHFALFDASAFAGDAEESEGMTGRSPGRRQPGSTQLGFQVDDLPATIEALRRAGAAVLQEPEEVAWGQRAVVADPDGRPVEINRAAAGS